MSKIVIAHAGKQHSFKTAEYLKIGGHDIKYITTVYDKKKNFTSRIKKFLSSGNADRANKRKSDVLSDDEVIQFLEIFGLLSLLLMRIDKTRYIYINFNKILYSFFSKKVARYCKKNEVDILIMYDGQAAPAFTKLSNSKTIKILDMSAASLPYMKQIYEKDILLNPEFASNLKKYADFIFDQKNQQGAIDEIRAANFILVPSIFSRKSLLGFIDDTKKILVCPYGFEKVDDTFFSEEPDENKNVFDFIYTGAVNQRKGISYLLETIDELKKKYPRISINLTLVGKYDVNDPIFLKYLNIYQFTGVLSHEDLLERVKMSDLFVFPSLSDSFAFSVIEALSVGVPVVCSDNTGASDYIKPGVNGYIFETQNKQQLLEILEKLIRNPRELIQLKESTRKVELINTWDSYGKDLLEKIEKVSKIK